MYSKWRNLSTHTHKHVVKLCWIAVFVKFVHRLGPSNHFPHYLYWVDEDRNYFFLSGKRSQIFDATEWNEDQLFNLDEDLNKTKMWGKIFFDRDVILNGTCCLLDCRRNFLAVWPRNELHRFGLWQNVLKVQTLHISFQLCLVCFIQHVILFRKMVRWDID